MLIIHIGFALASLGSGTLAVFAPARRTIFLTSGLAIATLATGTILAVQQPATMTEACYSGLAYLTIVTLMIGMAAKRLAHSAASVD